MSVRFSRGSWLIGSAAAGVGSIVPRPGRSAESAPIKVATVPREPALECFYAQELGFFQKRGLTVEITMMSNGAAIGAAVAGGAIHIGNSNVLALAQARQHNVPLIMIAPAGVHDARYPNSGCVVAAGSTIASPKELNGKVVAGASVGSYDQLCVSTLIDKDGGDSSTVKFVELPQPAMADALVAGRVVAASMSDPELSAARAAGRVRVIGDAESAVAKNSILTAWISTNDWLAANKDTARLFAAAIFDAAKWSMAHPKEAAVILGTRTGIKEQLAQQRFATNFDPSMLQPVLDAATKYKMLAGSISAADIAWNGK